MDLITIVGPTATGKTSLAANLAYKIDGEIISADSRQVYRDMNIGTGKDYDDYVIKQKQIPFHYFVHVLLRFYNRLSDNKLKIQLIRKIKFQFFDNFFI